MANTVCNEDSTCSIQSKCPKDFCRGEFTCFRKLCELCLKLNRPFVGQGHVTMSIIKIDHSTKWLPEIQKWKEHDEISKIANFETPLLKREILWYF